jgi:hypothetical protein
MRQNSKWSSLLYHCRARLPPDPELSPFYINSLRRSVDSCSASTAVKMSQIPDCGRMKMVKTLLDDPLVSGKKIVGQVHANSAESCFGQVESEFPRDPITFCGKYAEFYVKAALDYWRKIEKSRFQAQFGISTIWVFVGVFMFIVLLSPVLIITSSFQINGLNW